MKSVCVAWALIVFGLCMAANLAGAQVANIVLARPTARSILVTLIPTDSLQVYCEFGTARLVYTGQSEIRNASTQVPLVLPLTGLTPGTRYYYRLRYRPAGGPQFLAGEEHKFHTQRPRGTPFRFTIEADPHPYDKKGSHTLWPITLGNVLADSADFLLDLGDTFGDDHNPFTITSDEIRKLHMDCRSYFDVACHSTPLLFCLGNHEGQSGYYLLQTPPTNLGVYGWLLDGTADNLAVLATRTRTSFFPNPAPDGFYSGDTTQEDFVGQRQSYYAWEWGSALFVILDPYWHTVNKPGATKNLWDWTLGERQYRWFESTLARSTAGLKFVFAHQLVGGNDPEGQGGIEVVPFYEMGGRNADSSWGFSAARPGWPRALHRLMVDNHVTAVFHGHDHVFVKQDLDGMIYQELPQPGYYNFANPEKSYSNTGLAAKYGYTHGVVFSSSGYLRVSVTDTEATVAYVRSYLPEHETGGRRNGEVAFSYSLKASGPVSSAAAATPLPGQLVLSQNYPNPFNPTTVIRYQMPAAGLVILDVFDMLGREVGVLVRETQAAGMHEVRWVASGLPTGVFCVRLMTGGQSASRTMSLIR